MRPSGTELAACGRPCEHEAAHHDADVLIAAHALHYDAVIVSGNVNHFQETGAPVENWNERATAW